MSQGVYLDYNATTPVLPEVLEAMLPYFTERFGNAASPHLWGKDAQMAVEEARESLARSLGVTSQEIVFTSGATEALNQALFGIAEAYITTGRRRILAASTEHKAILDPLRILSKRGWITELLPVDENGLVSLDDLRRALRDDTLLVCIMLANNETGVIQPIAHLAKMAHEVGALFLCDTTQAIGKIPVYLPDLEVDLAVLSAHKFYGPKGIGALYIRRRQPRVSLQPLLYGGGHERGLRSGTLPVPLIVGMKAAYEQVSKDLVEESARQALIRDQLAQGLLHLYPLAQINGSGAPRLPNTLNISFPGAKASDILARAPLVAAATGSACTSARPEPSHVLLAMGLSPELARSTLRFSVGRFTTETDIQIALAYLNRALEALRPVG
ncbi:MAG: cysteine desulfurase [Bacteroidia bacterium]|nr:cysteine desulfurase [Bacteroidia bacterium]